ncbi:MAG: hypothetical protein ABJP87_04345 [Bauldia litoralis]|uniref:hypothetical protein n=1 Tax=Bauldia litoralis TaxID=665467 RepID=UPI003298BEE0
MNLLTKVSIVAVGGGIVLGATTLLPNRDLDKRPVGVDEVIPQNEESLFAEIGQDGTVLRVIVVDKEVIRSGVFGNPENWVRTYPDGRNRGKYAGRGDVYDKSMDTFATSTKAIDVLKMNGQ